MGKMVNTGKLGPTLITPPFTGTSSMSERSPLDIVSTANDPERGRVESSRGGEMKHRQETVAEKDWNGEFGSYDEWARLGPQPPYRSATFTDVQGRRCITQQDFARARDDGGFPVRYRWETTEARNRGQA